MKKLLLFSFLFFGLLFSTRVFAAEKINYFESVIKINQDATIAVQERITYNFGAAQRHGIYRTIPVKYERNGNNYFIEISQLAVVDENGKNYPFTAKRTGKYLNIKIGDPNQTVTGEKNYQINYQVKWAINFFSDHDELYWNTTGNEWEIPIERAIATVILPQLIDSEKVQYECFAGSFGSQSSCDDKIIFKDNSLVKSILFREEALPTKAGLTIVIGIPKDIISKPARTEIIQKILKDNLKLIFFILLPIIILIFLFYRWYRHGRDLPGRGTIIPQYDPPDNLTPAEIGTIIDETANNRDVSADIINLAVKGYLKIKKLSKDDYLLTKLKDEENLTEQFEKDIMKGLFGDEQDKKLSSLKYNFYKDLAKIRKLIYQRVTEKGYFLKNPQSVRIVYIIIGIAIIIFGFIFSGLFGPFSIFSFIISGLFFLIFSRFMPARTSKGTETKENILGLKMYLTVAEEARIKFHNAPVKNPEIFEKLLPYAMALKVEKEWAKQFEGIYNATPNWYNDPAGGTFNAIIFASALNSFSQNTNSVLAATPHASAGGGGSGFGGGGFSGGGFGGGGGGSW